jgi:MFS family permease
MERTASLPSRRSLKALDCLNIFLADVRDGVGPFLAIYLSSTQHWNAAKIGLAMSVCTIATVVVQTPAGWMVDQLRQKRALVVIGSILVSASCLAMIIMPVLPVIVSAQALIGIAGALFPPVIAAITLGLVGQKMLARQVGRNESFNHAGNVAAAAMAGLAGAFFGPQAIFILVAMMGVGSIFSVLMINAGEIDYEAARGTLDEEETGRVVSFREMLLDRAFVIFSLSTVLFHFANAAMLPLIGQKLSQGKDRASLYMAICIIVAQFVMIPVAIWAGRLAAAWGRRPVFLIGMAVLPIRGLLYTFSDNPIYLVCVQALDGIGAGIFGVLVVIVVADITAGTGRFNFAQGVLATATGLGASLSNVLTGFLVAKTSFNTGFLALSLIALGALLLFAIAMPETKREDDPDGNLRFTTD